MRCSIVVHTRRKMQSRPTTSRRTAGRLDVHAVPGAVQNGVLGRTMRVVEAQGFGGPEVLRLGERLAPRPAAGEVRIDVVAAGVNRPDVMQREGRYPPPAGASDVLGLEVAGRVVELGPDDEEGAPRSASGRLWRVGDQVMALVAGGGYAEAVAAPGVQCLPVPPGMSFVEAASIPETFFTVWTNVFERGRLQGGEWCWPTAGPAASARPPFSWRRLATPR